MNLRPSTPMRCAAVATVAPDVGPSIDSSFHIVGSIFDDVIKEGIHLIAGDGEP